MLISLLFIACVGLNVYWLGLYLFRPLSHSVRILYTGFKRSSRYLTGRLTEQRERALRQRTLKLLQQLVILMLTLSAIAIGYIPSIIFAHYHSTISNAFFSIEAIAGMILTTIVFSFRKVKA